MNKYTFSGHETFYCRHYWLKKAYDFIKDGNDFKDKDAVIKLGVGKNMVNSIRFWFQAFDINNEDKAPIKNKIGSLIFEDNGFDPYLEDVNSLWLLHYHLVKKGWASIYTLFFNKLKNGDREFTNDKIKKGLCFFVNNVNQTTPSEKTLDSDIKVFRANYMQPKRPTNIEDDFIGLLQELNLFEIIDNRKFIVQNTERKEISEELFLYAILDRFKDRHSISVEEIIYGENSPGVIFCMNEYGIVKKLKALEQKYPSIIFSEDAGVRELQLQEKFEKYKVLENYYV